MARIAPIRLQYSSKALWFDPGELEIQKGDAVVVTTARGLEYGHASDDIFEATEADIKKLKSELKPVKRLATPEDKETAVLMQEKSDEALPVFKEMAAQTNEDMHPVSVEFLLDGDKAIFYFESEDRVDFRDLVKKLASHFKVRIDMRQIGVRDEARIVGGLGHCGEELCCKRLGGEFCPVSIKMAKEQGLSLNPQKISGVCGRLMCCLRYEFDVYKDFKERAPKLNASIETPEGPAKVIDLNVPREIVTIQLSDDKTVKIPLAKMEKGEKGGRPNKVGKKAFDQHANTNIFDSIDSLVISRFGSTGLADGPLKKDRPAGGPSSEGASSKSSGYEDTRRQRRRTRPAQGAAEGGAAASEAKPKAEGSQKKQGQKSPSKTHDQAKQAGGQGSQERNKAGNAGNAGKSGSGGGAGKAVGSGNAGNQDKNRSNNAKRKPNSKKRKGPSGSEAQKSQIVSSSDRSNKASGAEKSNLRPGQKSSGLRSGEGQGSQPQKQRPPQQSHKEPLNRREPDEHRTSRRRSHTSGSKETGGADEV
ncbi:MAG: hypothetical protein FWE65_01670 [Eggerthellaceae bacterium]|nr:hypothetical protein [Eggerthellaceae bacterium]